MNIVFIEPLGICECRISSACQQLKENGHTITFFNNRKEDEATLIERAQDADVIIISNIPLRKSFFDACPKLKMISVAFTGVDHIDLDECKKRGIVVCNAAGYSTQAVAELAIGMMISTLRNIVGGDAVTRMGGGRESFLGSELGGKTVGIVGAGAIGLRVAQLAHAFGCNVIAYSRTAKTSEYIRFVDKVTLFREADLISLHLPLTKETIGFVGQEEFAQMKPHAILINTARGAVVDQKALFQALCDNKIAGAATDVYPQEPPLSPDTELFNAPNLLMLPHLGYATHESFTIRLNMVVRNVEQWLAGAPQNQCSL